MKKYIPLCAALAFVAAAYCLLSVLIGLPLFAHSPYDSYTLQAMLWRGGHVSFEENIEYLELAVYGGRYYVSFPPFPSLIMLPLTFLFGENTPSQFVAFALTVLSAFIAYQIAVSRRARPWAAAGMAVFCVLGLNMCEVCLYGGVWNIA